jgi:tRNA(Arg) A34 adenosine deaminase TadA
VVDGGVSVRGAVGWMRGIRYSGTMSRPTSFEVQLPSWLEDVQLPQVVTSEDALMDLLNDLAARNVEEGTGGPFAAAIYDNSTGEIVSIGVNLVLSANLSFAHAEMVTLSLAQQALGEWSLNADGRARTLMINAQPCAMCMGAIVWSGIAAIDFAALGSDVEALTGFDEGPVSAAWQDELESRGISVKVGRGEHAAHRVLEAFGARAASGNATLYNGDRLQD